MQFTLQTEKGELELAPFEVINMLMGRVTSVEKPDHETLARIFMQYLSRNEVLHTLTPEQLAVMSFSLGYFYRIFMEKNNVTVNGGNDENLSNSNNATPSS